MNQEEIALKSKEIVSKQKEIFEEMILHQSNIFTRVCTIKDDKERKEIFDLVESFFKSENRMVQEHSVMWKNLSNKITQQATGKKLN